MVELTKFGVFKRHNTTVSRLSNLKLATNLLLGIGGQCRVCACGAIRVGDCLLFAWGSAVLPTKVGVPCNPEKGCWFAFAQCVGVDCNPIVWRY